MDRKPKIKWRKIDEDKLRTAVRTFNRTRTIAGKKIAGIDSALPDKINLRELESELKQLTRQDFNRKIKQLKRYNIKSAMPVVTVSGNILSEWEIREERIALNILRNREARERKKRKPDVQTGNKFSEKAIQQGPRSPKASKLSGTDWIDYKKNLDKMILSNYSNDRWDMYKENFIKGLYLNLGYHGSFIAQYIDQLSPSQIADIFEAQDVALSFEFIYDLNESYYVATQILSGLERAGVKIDWDTWKMYENI